MSFVPKIPVILLSPLYEIELDDPRLTEMKNTYYFDPDKQLEILLNLAKVAYESYSSYSSNQYGTIVSGFESLNEAELNRWMKIAQAVKRAIEKENNQVKQEKP